MRNPQSSTGICMGRSAWPVTPKGCRAIGNNTPRAVNIAARTSGSVVDFFMGILLKKSKPRMDCFCSQKQIPSWHFILCDFNSISKTI
jgi:hypothetical protein